MAKFRYWMMHESNGRKYMATMGFGQHRGRHHTQVPKGYLRWALDNTNNFTAADRREIENYLKNPSATPTQPPPPPPQRSSDVPRTEAEFRKLTPEQIRNLGYRKMNSRYETPSKGIEVGDEIYYRPASGNDPVSVFRVVPRERPQQQERPVQQERPAQPTPQKGIWHCASMKGDPNVRIVLKPKNPADINGDWDYKELDQDTNALADGEISKENIDELLQFAKEANGSNKLVSDPMQWIGAGTTPDVATPDVASAEETGDEEEEAGEEAPSGPITLSREQEEINTEFGRIISSTEQRHMMINALAGSGKTTMLKTLAENYGNTSQKWLYLVFNNKNRFEGKIKFKKMPFVQIETTNSFLGGLLRSSENTGRIQQTRLIVDLSQEAPEKIQIIADGPNFMKIMVDAGIPNLGPQQLAAYNHNKTINSLITSIRYQFKQQTMNLAGLAKSFALNPSDPQSFTDGINRILAGYDYDGDIKYGDMAKVRERINKYKPSFRDTILDTLHDILGYDIMQKNFLREIVSATHWLMESTMPGKTSEKYASRGSSRQYDLSQYRDFKDDLWYTAVHANELKWPHYDIVLADEVQDFNECHKIMLQKLKEAGAKIVAVGDPNQAIYRFNGADSNSFQNLEKMLGNDNPDVMKGLSLNFRSRPAVIDMAKAESRIPGIEKLQCGKKFDDGWEGTATMFEKKFDDSFEMLSAEMQQNGATKETAFISRTTQPLVHVALRLLGDGIPFVIVGKDIAGDLQKHIKTIISRFSLRDDDNIYRLQTELTNYLDMETEANEGLATKKSYLQQLGETTEALLGAIGKFGSNGSIGDFKKWVGKRLGGLEIENKISDLIEYNKKVKEEHPVVLTTAHKAKGLEWARVFVMRYDHFPHPKAKRPEDIQQEENSRYVTLTRAKDEIHVLTLKGQPGYKEN